MEPTNYYSESKYCPHCDAYVRYLMSVQASYCVECGTKVHLFSKKDQKAFLANLKTHPKGGRKGRSKRVS